MLQSLRVLGLICPEEQDLLTAQLLLCDQEIFFWIELPIVVWAAPDTVTPPQGVTFFQWLHFSSSWIHVVVFRVDRRYHSVDVLTKMFDLVYSRVPGDLSITGHSLRANIIITDGAFHHWALSSQSVESIWAQIMIGLGPVLVIVASRNKDYVL